MTKAQKKTAGPRLPPKRRSPEEQRAALAADPEPKRARKIKWSPKCGPCWYSRCGRYMIHQNPAGFARGYYLVARSEDGDGLHSDGHDEGRWNFWGHTHSSEKFNLLSGAKDGAEDLSEVPDV